MSRKCLPLTSAESRSLPRLVYLQAAPGDTYAQTWGSVITVNGQDYWSFPSEGLIRIHPNANPTELCATLKSAGVAASDVEAIQATILDAATAPDPGDHLRRPWTWLPPAYQAACVDYSALVQED